jgi:hypothetical protein
MLRRRLEGACCIALMHGRPAVLAIADLRGNPRLVAGMLQRA